MKSVIDWNEIVPMLRKDLRDTLMLEAVLILSSGKSHQRTPKNHNHPTSTERLWNKDGDGKPLNGAGRRYRINKTVSNPPQRGKIGAIWKLLVESKNDFITYEGLASICKGQNAQLASMVCQLWERRFIDVESKKFIEAIRG